MSAEQVNIVNNLVVKLVPTLKERGHIQEGMAYDKLDGEIGLLYCIADSNTKNMYPLTEDAADSYLLQHMSREEMRSLAIENTRRYFPERADTLSGFLSALFGNEDAYPSSNAIILSNHKMCNGAIVMYYPGVLKKLCERCGLDRAYILPSSVHELLVLNADGISAGPLREMVRDINKSVVDQSNPADFLSDNIFLYDLETDNISVAEAV